MTTPDDPYGQSQPSPGEPPYGQPPYGQPPYGQPPYGQPEPPPYGQPPYAQQPYGQPPRYGYGPGYAGPYGEPAPAYDYAPWLTRAAGALVDGLLVLLCCVPLFVGGLMVGGSSDTGSSDVSGAAVALVFLGLLLPIAFWIWNVWREGTTGSTLGKRAVGTVVVKERTGQYLGGWGALGRQVLHVLDSSLCYLGYLWPIWDVKRQTFADKIVGSVVVRRAH